jgi:hypothetical protein
VGVMGRLSREEVRAWVEKTCDAQGVPVKVTDPEVVSRAAVLLGELCLRRGDRAGADDGVVTDAKPA